MTDHTIDVPGATLHHAVLGDLADATPASTPLVLTDRRNVGRSAREV